MGRRSRLQSTMSREQGQPIGLGAVTSIAFFIGVYVWAAGFDRIAERLDRLF